MAAPDTALEEVIVTARRVEERLQDVPISMTVFNQEQLTERNVLSARDLATYTPSLSVNGRYGTDNASFSIRGFSQEIRTTASVGMYFADVVAPRGGASGFPGGDGAGPGAFFDLQNVQVLKGPQGTLFGRNTTGGAVLLVPQKPTANFEGYVEQSAGNYDLLRTQAVVNVPFSDAVRFRAGVDYNQRDGYLNNTSGIGPDDFANVDYFAGRASLVVDVTPNVENYTIGSYSLSDTHGQTPRLFTYDPVPTQVAPGVFRPRAFSSYASAQLADNAANGKDGRFDVQSDLPNAHTRTEQWQLINTTAWTASDALTVKNIASYAELTNDVYSDLFGTNFYFPTAGGPVSFFTSGSSPPPGLHTNDQSTLTEELQFQGGSGNGRLVWQAGGYFESSQGIHPSGAQSPGNIHCDDVVALDCFDVVGAASGRAVGTVNWLVGTIDYRNLGIYGQSTYSLTDKLKATAGIRYTKDKAESDTETAIRRFVGPGRDQPEIHCINADSGHAFTEVVQNLSDCAVHYSKTTSAPTWVLGLDYKLTQDMMLYGKYARGYRQGSVSPVSGQGFNSYDEEQVDTYELGIKTSFYAPMRGTFNVAAFYNDFKDQQLIVGLLSNQITSNAGIVNAGASRIYGAEVETTLVPCRGMNVALSYAYLNTELQELDPVTIPPGSPYNLGASYVSRVGDPLPYTPKHKAALSATYTLPLNASIGQVSLGGAYTYQDDMFISATSPYGTIPSYELLNLNLAWNAIMSSRVDAALFMTNALDKEYRSGTSASWASFGFETEQPGEPRMYGARVRVNFGS